MEIPNKEAAPAPTINTAALAKANQANENRPITVASEQQPCNWELAWEDDMLVGKNIITGREFKGTKADFREMMKG